MVGRLAIASIVLVAVTLIIWAAIGHTTTVVPIKLPPSPGPAFQVEIVKSRLSRPLFGLLPSFADAIIGGNNPLLTYDSAGLEIRAIAAGRLELGARGWDLRLYSDANGKVTRTTTARFPIRLGGNDLDLRCRPADRPVGYLRIARAGRGQMRGVFRIELAKCENALSGKAMEWPPTPLTMVGAFDRLPPRPGTR